MVVGKRAKKLLDCRKLNLLNKPTVRLQKYLAACGQGSRRACEDLISSGAVSVNGVPVVVQGVKIDPEVDAVTVCGKPVEPEGKRTLMVNKPRGMVCTSHDPEGRKRVLDLLPDLKCRLYTVGRLDMDSEGLLLVTNDGELAHRLTHPSYHVRKVYVVQLDAPLTKADVAAFLKGVWDEGEMLTALSVRPMSARGDDGRYRIELGEGRNRHIRRMAESRERRVIRLRRIELGPLNTQGLNTGSYRELTPTEQHDLRKAVGLES